MNQTAKKGTLSAISASLGVLYFRYASRYFSPHRYLSYVPSGEELSDVKGRLTLEVVVHCWQYAHLLKYHLSSFVLHAPTQLDVIATVYYSPDDANTQNLLDYFSKIEVPNVTWNWQPMSTDKIMRRAIGRNQAALDTKADWIWFTDCDLVFHKGSLDAFASLAKGQKEVLLFPVNEWITPLLDDSVPMLSRGSVGEVIDIDTSLFHQSEVKKAVGPHQITHGDVARACGYCNNIKVYQTPEFHWKKTYEDTTYRWLLRTHGKGIEVPEVYRIRHQSKGRYQQGSWLSQVRAWIRLMQTKLKSQQ